MRYKTIAQKSSDLSIDLKHIRDDLNTRTMHHYPRQLKNVLREDFRAGLDTESSYEDYWCRILGIYSKSTGIDVEEKAITNMVKELKELSAGSYYTTYHFLVTEQGSESLKRISGPHPHAGDTWEAPSKIKDFNSILGMNASSDIDSHKFIYTSISRCNTDARYREILDAMQCGYMYSLENNNKVTANAVLGVLPLNGEFNKFFSTVKEMGFDKYLTKEQLMSFPKEARPNILLQRVSAFVEEYGKQLESSYLDDVSKDSPLTYSGVYDVYKALHDKTGIKAIDKVNKNILANGTAHINIMATTDDEFMECCIKGIQDANLKVDKSLIEGRCKLLTPDLTDREDVYFKLIVNLDYVLGKTENVVEKFECQKYLI